MVVLHLLNELIRGVRDWHLVLQELGSLLDWMLLDVLRSIISLYHNNWRTQAGCLRRRSYAAVYAILLMISGVGPDYQP
jgi:hypothetical protein